MTFPNPYSSRGQPVSGERLVGRTTLLDRLTRLSMHGSHCSIVGLPRLGKTSIARQCMHNLRGLNRACGYVTLDAVRGPAQAYARILSETASDDDAGVHVQALQSHDEAYEGFYRTLRQRMRRGQTSMVVVDEVDAVARDDFSDAQLFVGRLREIANDRDRYGLSFMFVSRRSLDMIQGAVDCSTLAGLCEVIYVPPLCRDEVQVLMARSSIPLDASGESALWGFTGGHPFFSEVIMCEVVERRSALVDAHAVEAAQHAHAHEFTNHYRQLQTLLEGDGMFDSLCELTVGPQWRQISAHTNHLLQHYGLTKRGVGDTECMSQHLCDYLALTSRLKPTWALLGETETRLRSVVDDRLASQLGDAWLEPLSQRYPTMRPLSNRLLEQQIRERRQFGSSASEVMLDYAYIGELREIMFAAWDLFRPILGGNKNEWNQQLQQVILVRNPVAHHRRVPADLMLEAERSCRWILARLDARHAH